MIVKLTRTAMLDTEFRIQMFSVLRSKNIPFYQYQGVINFVVSDEYDLMKKLGNQHVNTMIARELDISPETLQ